MGDLTDESRLAAAAPSPEAGPSVGLDSTGGPASSAQVTWLRT